MVRTLTSREMRELIPMHLISVKPGTVVVECVNYLFLNFNLLFKDEEFMNCHVIISDKHKVKTTVVHKPVKRCKVQ